MATKNNSQYKRLIAAKIEVQTELLVRRIRERFPDSSLSQVAIELHEVASQTRERVAFVSRPVLWLRSTIVALILLIFAGITALFLSFGAPDLPFEFVKLVQLLESGVNDLVFIGLAIFFLTGLESRLKRKKALDALHELRSLAHIIDMHQLTKDPASLLQERTPTESSPPLELNAFQLKRYLEYCSELLSLTAKLSALFAQALQDSVVLSTVNELESLANGLSNKVWQKMNLIKSDSDRSISE